MRTIIAAACIACFASVFASARVVVQNNPGGQAGNPSVVPAPAMAPPRAIAPPPAIAPPTANAPAPAPAPASAPKIRPVVPLEMRRTAETGDAERPRAIHLAAASPPARIQVQLATQLSSATSRIGDTWRGTLAREVVLDGQTIAHAGDQVTGKVTFVRSRARSQAPGELTLRLTAVNGHPVFSSAVRPKAAQRRDGAALGTGALLGGFAGAGNGPGVGATAGAGAGTAATSPEKNNRELVLPAESILTFTITKKPDSTKR